MVIGMDGGRQEGEKQTDLTHGLEWDFAPDRALVERKSEWSGTCPGFQH